MANNLITASVGRINRLRMSRASEENSVVISGIVHRLYTYDALDKDVAKGITAVYRGTGIHVNDDFSTTMYRLYTLTRSDVFVTFNVAIEA